MNRADARERAFHDRIFAEGTRRKLDKFYSVTSSSRDCYASILESLCAGRRVLEYGCGTAGFSVFMTWRGASVTAVDISPIAIEQSRRWVSGKGVPGIRFCAMNAETLAFRDHSFDLVCGTGILHHLDLTKAIAELARVLTPGGTAVFIEPLGHNPLINFYRKLTPQMRSADEHPLRMRDLKLASRYFGQVDCRFFHLHSLLAVPFRNRGFFDPLLGILEACDRLLFAIAPFARRYAWTTVLRLSQPRRT